MKKKQAIALLKKYATKDSLYPVLNHSLTVEQIAKRLAKGIAIDQDLLVSGAILHDIGRFDYPPWQENMIKHGIHGGHILRKHKLYREARIAERHIGPGLTKNDIIKERLPLPKKDYIPKTKVEKIISIADSMTKDDQEVPISYDINRLKKKLGVEHAKRLQNLYNEVIGMQK